MPAVRDRLGRTISTGVAALAATGVLAACSATQTAKRWERLGPSESFIWPTTGEVSSGFGPRDGVHHDGIDIAAAEGTAVRAAANGIVLYSGVLGGYGQVVILDHGRGLASVYAHNSENLVDEGAEVRRGTPIATVGSTGRATGPNLHFEIRRANTARDPMIYLPQRWAPPALVAKEGSLPFGG